MQNSRGVSMYHWGLSLQTDLSLSLTHICPLVHICTGINGLILPTAYLTGQWPCTFDVDSLVMYISGHVFLQLSSSSNHLAAIFQDNSSWQTDVRTHPLKSMASGPLKIEKGTRPVLILATHRHTTESAVSSRQ